MNNTAKERLHKILNVLYYIIVTVNIMMPVFLTTVSTIAVLHLKESHWSIKLITWASLIFSAISLVILIKKSLNIKRTK